jgi:hypothetical protein
VIENILRYVVILGLAVAAGASVYGALTLLHTGVLRIAARRRSWLDKLWDRNFKVVSPAHATVTVRAKQSPMPFVIGGVSLLLAIKATLTGNLFVGVALIVAGAGTAWYMMYQANHTAQGKDLTEAVERMLTAFRSHYTLNGAAFAAMEGTFPDIQSPYLEELVRNAISTFRLQGDKGEALEWLTKAHNTYLDQFVFILNRESQSSPQAVSRMLEALVKRLGAKRRLDRRLKVAVAPLEGTVRFLEAANVIAILVVVNVPFWWGYYASAPLVLLVGLAGAVGASLYFDYRIHVLSDRAL